VIGGRRPGTQASFGLRTMAGGVVLVVALVLLASIALVATHRQQSVSQITTTAHDQATVTRNLVASVSVPEAEVTARDLAAEPALIALLERGGSPTDTAFLLDTATPPQSMALYVIGRDGTPLASLPGSASTWTSASSTSAVAGALAGGTVAAPSSSVPGGGPAEIAAVPIRSGDTILGAVAAVMPLTAQLQRFAQVVGYPILLVPAAQPARATVVGGGATMAGGDVATAIGDRLSGSPSEVTVSSTINGEPDILDLVPLDPAAQPHGESDYVGVVVPSPGFLSTEGSTLFTVALLAVLAATLTSLAVLLFVDRSVRRPVAELERGVARIAAEDYGTDIPVRSDDELGRLASAVNGMARRIGEAMEQTRSALVHLRRVSEALTTSGAGAAGMPGAIARAAAEIAGSGASACLLTSTGSVVHGDAGDVAPEREAAERADPTITERQGDDGRWRTAFPLAVDDETVVGRLVVITSAPTAENERSVLTTLANNAGIALDHARLLEQEQEAVRRLRAVDRTRTEFLRTTHHELRTPLTVVLGMTELAESSWDKVDDQQRREFMTATASGARQLAYTIEEVLTVTALSAEEVTLQRRAVDLRWLVEQCVADVVSRRGVEATRTVRIDVSDDLSIDADAVRFRQMLDALLDNALKFSGPGGTVSVAAEREGSEVVLHVTDDGVGIPDDAQPRVFEQFFQAESGHVREFGGLGLGLTISARVCTLHGAHIDVRSTEGKGTDVVVRWPAAGRSRTRDAVTLAEIR
jgi:signal transduction histidine kinase